MKRIRDVADLIMGTSPKGHTYNSVGEGLPLLNGPTEFGDSHPECTIFTTSSVKECASGDLIFCVRGSTTGRMNWADRIYSLGRGVCAIRGATDSDTKYIRYCLDYKLPALLQLASGATFPNLPQDTINDFEIPFPPNHKEIASTLSAYDDLIENNRRRMELLEEAARQLYREWFVRLRFPGREHTRIINGVPEGWEEGQVGALAKLQSGYAFKSKDWVQEGNPVIKIANIDRNIVDTTQCECVSDEVAEQARKFILKQDDLLIAMTGATIGKIGIMPRSKKNCYLNQRVGIFRIQSEINSVPFLFTFFNTENARHQVVNFAAGAAQPNISPTQIESIKLLIPSKTLFATFADTCEPLFSQRLVLLEQNEYLKAARDLLLPRLMRGEIAV